MIGIAADGIRKKWHWGEKNDFEIVIFEERFRNRSSKITISKITISKSFFENNDFENNDFEIVFLKNDFEIVLLKNDFEIVFEIVFTNKL